MPTYGYHCSNCKKEIEVFQKITDAPLKNCPQCNQETIHRGPGGGVGLAFTGSGFYITDYARNPSEKKGGCCPCGKNKNSCSSE